MNTLPEKKDDILKKLITSDFQEPVPANFTNDVLNRLNISTVTAPVKYEPVIPLRGWILIASIVGTLVLLSSGGSNSSAPSNSILGIQFQNLMDVMLNIMIHSNFVHYTFVLSLAVLAILFVESFYRKSRVSVF